MEIDDCVALLDDYVVCVSPLMHGNVTEIPSYQLFMPRGEFTLSWPLKEKEVKLQICTM